MSEPLKWIPLQNVFALVEKSKLGIWTWARNTKCKYIDVRIDMRDGDCIIKDRDGNIITLEQLQWQYTPEKEQS